MDRLVKTTQLLTDIQITSNSILYQANEILSQLDDDSEIIENVIDESNTNESEETVSSEICKIVSDLISDAKIVKTELPEFVEAFQKGEEAIEDIESQFFLKVWYGDMYGTEGIEALEELRDELKKQLKSLSDEEITKELVSRFSNNSSSKSQSEGSIWSFLGF